MDLKKLVWNVICENINAQKMEIYNVFEHGGFMRDVQRLLAECETRAEFSERLLRSVKYYFWAKSQFEVLIRPLIEGRTDIEKKIDPAWQLMNNWDIFVDYVWSAKPQINKPRIRPKGNENEQNRDNIPNRRVC